MKLDDFSLEGGDFYDNGVYAGKNGYDIQKRYKFVNTATDKTTYLITDDDGLYEKLLSLPAGEHTIQYRFEILDGSTIKARTEWSNYVDYIAE